MQYYDENENAVVNTEPTTSETPSNLVEKKDEGLSPNPAGFGFTKQLVVDSLPDIGAFDTLYLLRVYDGNGNVKEYYKYRWTYDRAAGAEGRPTQPHWERVFEPVNNVKHEDGAHETPVVENTQPTPAPEKVFNGEVVFNEEPTIKGKKLHEWIDSEGGVTEEELQEAIANKQFSGTIEVAPAAHDYIAANTITSTGVYLLHKPGTAGGNLGLIVVYKEGGTSFRVSGLYQENFFKGILNSTQNFVIDEHFIKLFDGDVAVTYPQGVAKIESANYPTKVGVYRLVYSSQPRGIIFVTSVSSTVINFYGLCDYRYFQTDNIGGQNLSEDFIFSGNSNPLTISPNPTLAGTETALTGLQIGGDKYKISGGTKLYRHIFIYDNKSFEIITPYSSPFNTIASGTTINVINGNIVDPGPGTLIGLIYKISVYSSNTLTIKYFGEQSDTISASSITDTVTEL